MNTLLPTTTAGSLPKPSWLAQPETLWSPWKLEGEELAEGRRDALLLALAEQQAEGIDVVSDGEQTRQHFVTTFIENLEGVDFEDRRTVTIRDRYEASVPSVVGPVSRRRPVFVEDAAFLRRHTEAPIKWALPGPMTMIESSTDAHTLTPFEAPSRYPTSCGFGSLRPGRRFPARRSSAFCSTRMPSPASRAARMVQSLKSVAT